MEKLVVIGLGGHALLAPGEGLEAQRRRAAETARRLAPLLERGYRLLLVHGNGPQAGLLLELARRGGVEMRLDEVVAATQGWLGYLLAAAVGDVVEGLGLPRRAVALVTMVMVDPGDPMLSRPVKPVGPLLSAEEAEELRRRGAAVAWDPRGGWRRLVPSPRPRLVVEEWAVRSLFESGALVVVAGGGGGVAVTTKAAGTVGVEAVVDKDFTASLLARRLEAETLLLLTDVEGVYEGYGRPGARLLRRLNRGEARRLLPMLPPGSMGAKLAAALEFVEATGRPAAIGPLEAPLDVLEGRRGTRVEP